MTRSLPCIVHHAARLNFVRPERVVSHNRQDAAAFQTRAIIAVIAREYGHSFPAIAEALCRQDHTTIRSALQRAQEWLLERGHFAALVEDVRRAVASDVPRKPKPVPPVEDDDDSDAMSRRRGTRALLLALREQHPERMGL